MTLKHAFNKVKHFLKRLAKKILAALESAGKRLAEANRQENVLTGKPPKKSAGRGKKK